METLRLLLSVNLPMVGFNDAAVPTNVVFSATVEMWNICCRSIVVLPNFNLQHFQDWLSVFKYFTYSKYTTPITWFIMTTFTVDGMPLKVAF